MRNWYVVILCIFFSVSSVYGQHDDHDHHGRNEIGVSAGGLYGTDDSEWGTGVHLHYFRTFRDHSSWAFGGFVEQAWLDGTHFSAGGGVKYEVVEGLHIGVFPGFSVAKHDHNHHSYHKKTKTRFSIHTELVYDLFKWEHFHVGPVFDYSWSDNDSHLMLGAHVAYSF